MTQDPQEYLKTYQEKIAANPDCGMTRYNYAVALVAQHKFDEAEAQLQQAVSCSPTLAEAYVLMGGICLQRNDLEGCLRYNQQATQVRPRFAEGYGNVGFIHLQQGDIDKAITALEKAVNFNPMFLQAHANLGNAYLMKGMIDKSIEINHKVIEMAPAFAVAHNNLAIAYLQKGDLARAKEHCEQAESLGYQVAPEIKDEINQKA